MKKQLTLAGLLCATVLAACDKNGVQNLPTEPVPSSEIKFFNFGVGSPSVNFYSDDTKMTAILSASGSESTLGVAYGGVGSGGYYSGIAAGQHTVTGRISATTDKDLTISSVVATIADGKAYSYYQSGIYNTTSKTVDAFIVADDIPAIDYTVAYVRFVNAISNANPMTLYAKNSAGTEVAVGPEVAYKGAGTFTSLPEGVYTLATRYSGSSTNAITRTGVSFLAGHVYTIGARGNITVASTVALDNTANR